MSATNGLPISLTAQLCFWRGIVGIGVGGEYPLSATVSAEGVSTAGRGRVLALVMAMQGFGNILSTLVMYILLGAWFGVGANGANRSPPPVPLAPARSLGDAP